VPACPLWIAAADTQRPKGFGFIEFMDLRDAEEAIYNLDRSMFGSREIQVCECVLGRVCE
jgi:RNA recognition motif-containing protein